jgi:LPXTG-motif cell wall-anchored protein
MTQEQSISLYLQLTGDIRSLWFAFGGLAVVVAGWLLARKHALGASQRLALTIGWLSASGYLGSALMNRYRLAAALVAEVKSGNPQSAVAKAIAAGSDLYEHYDLFVWGSLGAISVAAMLLIWSNVAVQVENPSARA